MQTQSSSLERLDSLQTLRGFASIWVLCFHWGLAQNWGNTWVGMQGWFNGFLGVDVFFVLSGFVNGLLIQKSSEVNQITFSKYLNRRFFRIVIPTWVSIVMVVLVSWSEFGSQNYWQRILHSFLFIPTGKGAAPFYGYMFHIVVWSLFYEMLFYVSLSVTFFLKSYRIPALLLLLIIPVFFNPISIWNPYEPKPINALEIYEVIQLGFTNPMMLEFALGLIGAWVYHWVFHLKQIPLKPNWTPTIAWGLAIIVAISVLFLIFTPVQRHGIWPNGLVAFALVMGLAFQETIVKQKYHKIFVYLGTLSFPLFLTHTGWIAIWHQVWPKWNPYVPFGWAILISLILSFALAHGFGKALKIL